MDIVERLKDCGELAAADEIESLRRQVEYLKKLADRCSKDDGGIHTPDLRMMIIDYDDATDMNWAVTVCLACRKKIVAPIDCDMFVTDYSMTPGIENRSEDNHG